MKAYIGCNTSISPLDITIGCSNQQTPVHRDGNLPERIHLVQPTSIIYLLNLALNIK